MTDELFTPQYENYYELTIVNHEDDLDRYGNWLAGNIRMYDPHADHIGVLRDLIVEMRRVLDAVNQITHDGSDETRYGIDMAELPSVQIPTGIMTDYPIWAMDFYGNVLVGENTITSITSIILAGRHLGHEQISQYDPDAPILLSDLQEPIRSWYYTCDDIGVDTGGFVFDPFSPDCRRLTWKEVVDYYGYKVWDIRS